LLASFPFWLSIFVKCHVDYHWTQHNYTLCCLGLPWIPET
jgi:hypothetical protein